MTQIAGGEVTALVSAKGIRACIAGGFPVPAKAM